MVQSISNQAAHRMSDDELVRKVSAFSDYADLIKSMDSGYVPTLRRCSVKGVTGSDRIELDGWNHCVVHLRGRLQARGRKVYPETI